MPHGFISRYQAPLRTQTHLITFYLQFKTGKDSLIKHCSDEIIKVNKIYSTASKFNARLLYFIKKRLSIEKNLLKPISNLIF